MYLSSIFVIVSIYIYTNQIGNLYFFTSKFIYYQISCIHISNKDLQKFNFNYFIFTRDPITEISIWIFSEVTAFAPRIRFEFWILLTYMALVEFLPHLKKVNECNIVRVNCKQKYHRREKYQKDKQRKN